MTSGTRVVSAAGKRGASAREAAGAGAGRGVAGRGGGGDAGVGTGARRGADSACFVKSAAARRRTNARAAAPRVLAPSPGWASHCLAASSSSAATALACANPKEPAKQWLATELGNG